MSHLWTFRRCPYAIRARMAIEASGIQLEYREIILRDKPPAMLADSPKGTVPILVDDGRVVDESIDIALWALGQNDPHQWLQDGWRGWSTKNDAFKLCLDRYKYGDDKSAALPQCRTHLTALESQLQTSAFLLGTESLADVLLVPFVRQFHHCDKSVLPDYPKVVHWLEHFTSNAAFARVMEKRPRYAF